MVVTLAVAAILLSFSAIGIARVRGSMRLTSASDDLTQYLERARQDSIRRHAESTGAALPSADRTASITFDSATTYTITMDFDGDGTVEATEARTFTLPDGISFPAALITVPAKTVTFDWRGRPSEEINTTLSSSYGSKTIAVSESGSIASYDTHQLDGFELAGMPSPEALPKSDLGGGGESEEQDGGDSKGNDKKDDPPSGDDPPADDSPGKGNDKKDDPPADDPPADDPPADQPPADNPPADNPPAGDPPADNPPADNPPADNPGKGNDKKGDPPTSPPSTPTPTPSLVCGVNEKQSERNCVCDGGRRVRTNGKCQ